MLREFSELRSRLSYLGEREAYKWWRIARRAKAKGLLKLSWEIQYEASRVWDTAKSYPYRFLSRRFNETLKYAFKDNETREIEIIEEEW